MSELASRFVVGLLFVLATAFWAVLMLSFRVEDAVASAIACLAGGGILGAFAWGMRRWLRLPLIFLGLVMGQCLIAWRFTPRRGEFLGYLTVGLVIPGLALMLAHRRKWRDSAQLAVRVLFVACLLGDLIFRLSEARLLRLGLAHPAETLKVDTHPALPSFPHTRFPAAPYDPELRQPCVRYLPLLEHRAYAFSASDPPTGREDYFSQVLHGRRWTSFLLSRTYFDLIHSALPDAEIKKSFAIGRPLLQFRGAKAEGFHLEVESYYYDSLVVRVQSAGPGLLYWSDGFDPDWRAESNGKPIPVQRADESFKAVAIGPGVSEVRFTYRPWKFILGLAAFYGALTAGIGAIIGLSLKERINKRRDYGALGQDDQGTDCDKREH